MIIYSQVQGILAAMEMPDSMRPHAAAVLEGEYDLPLDPPPTTVLDLGGNVGAFALWAQQKWPDARIRAYEPIPANCTHFARNVRGVHLVRSAVSNMSGRFLMGPGPNNCGEWSLSRYAEKDSIVVDVRGAECIESAEFVKVDIEGAEREVLERLDLSPVRGLAVEIHAESDVRPIRNRCHAAGLLLHAQVPSDGGNQVLKFVRKPAAKKLFVAVPCYGQVPAEFMTSLMRLQRHPPCDMSIHQTNGDSLVTRARNGLTADFLETDCSHLLWIDSDLVFTPSDVRRLMEHAEDLVGGLYAKKQRGPAAWVLNTCETEQPSREDGLQRVKYIGTGLCRISRRVFETMIAAHGGEIEFRPDQIDRRQWDFWRVGVYNYPSGARRYLSEDWWFCEVWNALGGTVWADTRVVAKHIGSYAYPERIE